MDVQDNYTIDTNLFSVNDSRDTARLVIDDNTNTMTLGGANLQNLRIRMIKPFPGVIFL